MGVESQLKAYVGPVEARLAEILPPETAIPSVLHQAMRYSALAPGKRLRPALVLASASAANPSEEVHVLDAACAVELVHAFSLIHDDLPALDDDELRRGKPTCHVVFGEANAILAGDALFALAFETLANGTWGPTQRCRAVATLARASMQLVQGETQDLLSEKSPADQETLEFIHQNKTGALIAASCEIGGLLSGADPSYVHALRQYGEAIGLAFQIADDLLNETATAEQLGKSAGSDRERGKATYPALFGIEESRQRAVSLAAKGVSWLGQLPGDTRFLVELANYSIQRLQ